MERPPLKVCIAELEAKREAEERAAQEIPQYQDPGQEPVYIPVRDQPVIIQSVRDPPRRAPPQPQPLRLLDRWGSSVAGPIISGKRKRRS